MATATYDPRTGKKLNEGTTQDFSNFKGALNFDARTGKRIKAPSVISSETLKPAEKMVLTQPKPSVSSLGMGEEISSLTKNTIDQYTKNLQEKSNISEISKNTALDEYLSNLMGSKGETELKSEAYSKTVDPLESELISINNQILAEDNANRRKIQALEKNPQGLLAGALNDEINRVNDESLARKADLYVIQMGVQGKYDSAKSIADRAISARLERQRNLNEALKINYEEKKDLFNKEEQRAFESAQSDRERLIRREEDNLKEISDLSITALKNGAPSSLVVEMRRAKTPEDAIKIGGNYIMSIDDRIKNLEYKDLINTSNVDGRVLTDKEKKSLLTDPTAKATTSMISVNNLLQDYKNLVSGFGDTPTPSQRKKANSFLTNVLGPSLAVAQGQGALQKDEADRLIDSLGVKGLWKREKITLGNIDSAINGFNTKINTNFDYIESVIPGASDNFDVFKNYKTNSLPPEQKAKVQKIDTYKSFKNEGFTDDDVIEYFTEIDPQNAETIRQLYSEGYSLEDILNTL